MRDSLSSLPASGPVFDKAGPFLYNEVGQSIPSPTQGPEGRGRSGEIMRGTDCPNIMKGDIIMETVVQLIQTVGFPIACAVAMFIMLNNEQKAHKEESQQLTTTITDLKISFSDAINQQKAEMVNAINNNTLVIQKLLDRMDDK